MALNACARPVRIPVSRSTMMRAEMTWPNGQNALKRSRLVMSLGMWNTKRLQPNGPQSAPDVWIGGPGPYSASEGGGGYACSYMVGCEAECGCGYACSYMVDCGLYIVPNCSSMWPKIPSLPIFHDKGSQGGSGS